MSTTLRHDREHREDVPTDYHSFRRSRFPTHSLATWRIRSHLRLASAITPQRRCRESRRLHRILVHKLFHQTWRAGMFEMWNEIRLQKAEVRGIINFVKRVFLRNQTFKKPLEINSCWKKVHKYTTINKDHKQFQLPDPNYRITRMRYSRRHPKSSQCEQQIFLCV